MVWISPCKNIRESDIQMPACTYNRSTLASELRFRSIESHPPIHKISLRCVIQCKLTMYAVSVYNLPLEVAKKTITVVSVFKKAIAFCLFLTDVFSSEPCSLPCAVGWIDADRAQKHGMDEFISANPCSFDHASLFEMVQRLTLDHRLNDTFCCLVGDPLPVITSPQDTFMAVGCFC